jgi:hypothetical protein
MVLSPWFRHFLDYDPRPALRKTKCPVLALDGEKDLQVDAKTNLKAIADALKEGGNKDFTVREVPNLNHLFQTCKTGAVSEYNSIEETFAPLALETIGDWILERTPAGSMRDQRMAASSTLPFSAIIRRTDFQSVRSGSRGRIENPSYGTAWKSPYECDLAGLSLPR